MVSVLHVPRLTASATSARLPTTVVCPKVCPKGCLEKGIPVHKKACMHSNQAPFISVSKVSANRLVPLVETVLLGNTPIGIQYDTGCQLSLISRSVLS